MFRKNWIPIISIIIFFITLSSCGPLGFTTRMKKIPREYTYNYCGQAIKAPKTEWDNKVWVVFSDRAKNVTYQNPGGKVKLKEAGFMEPFVVIKEKGDFLCIVKYDPEVVDPNLLNTKFKDKKKAQHYGWINKSNLLLTRQTVTDIATGFKNKQISIIADTIPLNEPDLYFTKDSIRVFKDLNLSIENTKIPFYQILYTLKLSPDRKKALVAHKTEIAPDSAETQVLGWVHQSLLEDIGQRLHINTNSFDQDYLLFKDKRDIDTIFISPDALDTSNGIARRHKALKYSPVTSWHMHDSILRIKTSIPAPIIDQSDNYVFNVNGNKIWYTKFKELEKQLKKINLLFIFEGKEQIIQNFSALINVIQNLQPLFEETEDNFSYKFGSVIATQGSDWGSSLSIKKKEFTSDYAEFIDYLVAQTDTMERARPLTVHQTWAGVREAANMIQNRTDETNLLIIMGEAGYSEGVDTLLLNKITDANSRVLGFQLQGEVDNSNNNFVLQIESMINYYAYKTLRKKREVIVYADQLRNRNRYRESSKNIYALDFPDRSMTQGWILFPEKDATLPLDILTTSIDSLVTEVKWDNENITNSLYKAFNTVGNHRYKYDSLFVDYFNPQLAFNRKIPTYFSEIPAWYIPTQRTSIPDSLNSTLRYHLLLSEDELGELVSFLAYLSENELDYKYKGKKKKTKNYCNCPDDEDIDVDVYRNAEEKPEYMSTKKSRREIKDLYLEELRTCKLCKIKTKHLKKYTLAEAQRRIVGCPTYHPLLEKYTINDLKKKKKITDVELDGLITYIKEKKELLEKYLHNPDKFESGGQIYYWIDQQLLP